MSWRIGLGSASAALAALLALAAPAQAELRFERCKRLLPCAQLSVPLDRTGVTPGRVSLHIQRLRAQEGPSQEVVFTLAGGPGQSATFSIAGEALGALGTAFRRRDLIVFDQRGTGRSDALRCHALQSSNLFDAGRAAGRCAQELGPRRFHYTSRASVEDIEAIRSELGVERITLYGTSYGVKVALGYALTYPARVKRLVLDSVVEVDGPDTLYRDTVAAIPRVLRSLCRAACGSFTADPVADLSALVTRLASGPLSGRVIDSRGRGRRTSLSSGELLLVLLAGDFDPVLRAATPGAVRAALDGDPVPLLRLKRRLFPANPAEPPARVFSAGLFAATTCEEGSFPWARTSPPDPFARRALAEAALAALAPGSLAPLAAGVLVANDLLKLCDRWPAAPAAPSFGPGPLPDVPALILQGEDDLRTPVENAQRVAALLPQSQLVVAPATGHSALSSDLSGCAQRAFERFFTGRAVRQCPQGERGFPPSPPPPLALAGLAPARGADGVRGRALGALGLTLGDVAEDSLNRLIVKGRASALARGGGLRAGSYRLDSDNTLHLRAVAFVPGVRVTGVVRRFTERAQKGRVRLFGPNTPDGRLLIDGRRLSGRLAGAPVSAILPGGASGSRAAAPPPRRLGGARW